MWTTRFASADVVIRRRLDVARLAPSPMEGRAILAAPTDDGGVRIWYSTQTPYVLKRALAGFLDVDPEAIRVTCPQVGGGFGQKSHVYPEDILIPWLACRLGRPVRWLEDRTENLIASCHARGQVVDAALAATAGGEILAIDADITVDVGAYGVYPHGQLIEVGGTPNMLTGPYRIPELRFRARAIATNLCPGGGYRGVGLASAVFVHERLIDILATELGVPAADVRRRNLLRSDELPYANPRGLVFDSGDYPAALELALEAVGTETLPALRAEAQARGERVGLGLCSYNEYTGMGSNVFTGRGMVAIAGYEESRISITLDGDALVRPTVPDDRAGLGDRVRPARRRRPRTAAGRGRGAPAGHGRRARRQRRLREPRHRRRRDGDAARGRDPAGADRGGRRAAPQDRSGAGRAPRRPGVRSRPSGHRRDARRDRRWSARTTSTSPSAMTRRPRRSATGRTPASSPSTRGWAPCGSCATRSPTTSGA